MVPVLVVLHSFNIKTLQILTVDIYSRIQRRIHVDFSRNGFCFWVGKPSRRRSCGSCIEDNLKNGLCDNVRMQTKHKQNRVLKFKFKLKSRPSSPLVGDQNKTAASLCTPEDCQFTHHVHTIVILTLVNSKSLEPSLDLNKTEYLRYRNSCYLSFPLELLNQ